MAEQWAVPHKQSSFESFHRFPRHKIFGFHVNQKKEREGAVACAMADT